MVSGLSVSGNQALGTTALSLATVSGVSLADVTVSADVTLPAVNGRAAGLVRRYGGPGSTNLYFGAIRFAGGVYSAVIFRNVGGTWTVLGTSASLGSANVSRNVRFHLVRTSLLLFVNNVMEVGRHRLGAGGRRRGAADDRGRHLRQLQLLLSLLGTFRTGRRL